MVMIRPRNFVYVIPLVDPVLEEGEVLESRGTDGESESVTGSYR